MPKKRFKSLRTKTAVVVLIALIIGLAVYYLINGLSDLIISNVYCSEERSEQRLDAYADSFNSYVIKNDITSENYAQIKSWCKVQKYVYLSIYDNDILRYETDGTFGELYNNSDYISYLEDEDYFVIDFKDGEKKVSMIEYSQSPYYSTMQYISYALGVIVVLMIILSFNLRIIRRTIYLSGEVREVCFGDINKNIELKGDDEISELGADVNEMRKSIISHYEKEQKALDANTELLTSISHDIRTPLTSLIGYSEMMTDNSITDIDEIKKYATICRDKAYRLKNMTDTLFQYFLVYGNNPVELDMQEYSADDLLEQLIGEYLAELRQKDFIVQTDVVMTECRIKTDIVMLKRVFDNVFSNIEKYADIGKNVNIRVSENGNSIIIQISNSIKTSQDKPESTKIGLKTCEKIMDKLNGMFKITKDRKTFTVNIIIKKSVN